jgi:predicted MFS family arabinose efflux permease
MLLLAAGAGLSAASLYYNQPILDAIAHDLHASVRAIGYVPMLTQLGYAAGILLFAPLGDRHDRRALIVVKSALLAAALCLAALSPRVEALCGASLAIGLAATAAQDFVPLAAALAVPERRGKTVGSVMTGLLLGILLSRLASGAAGARFGWRAVFFGAAAVSAIVAFASATLVPRVKPTVHDSYGALLRSLVTLARDLPALRRATLAQSLLSIGFGGFWATLALVLAAPPFRFGSAVAGAFGIAGAAGAAIAPVAGSLADRRGPDHVVRIGALVVIVSFASMALAPGSLVVLVAATIAFDLGIQACLIAHQTIIYGLDPAARSRLNAILVSSMFFGMATGAALANRAFVAYGFVGVATLGVIAAAAALVVRIVPPRIARAHPAR